MHESRPRPMQAVAHKTRNHNALHQAYIMLFFQAKQQLFTSFVFNLRHCKMLLITVSIIHCHNSLSVTLLSGQLAECYSSAIVTRQLLERYSTTVPANTNYIWWNAVPPAKYLVERRSTAFPLHYSTGVTSKTYLQARIQLKVHFKLELHCQK